MKSFSGFPAGKISNTPLPNLFFTELLPLIDNLAELKVTLHLFWRLYHMRDYPRCISYRHLAADTTLLRSLNELGGPVHEVLDDGLERAVTRGTFIQMVATEATSAEQRHDPEPSRRRTTVVQERNNGSEQARRSQHHQSDLASAWFFPNTVEGRRSVERVQAGHLRLPDAGVRAVELPVSLERPNIFLMYEHNIGVLTPLIADQLRDAEETYPAEWIEDAFRIAVEHNARKWAYVRSILERWASEGRDDGTNRQVSKDDPDRYIPEEYADYVEQ